MGGAEVRRHDQNLTWHHVLGIYSCKNCNLCTNTYVVCQAQDRPQRVRALLQEDAEEEPLHRELLRRVHDVPVPETSASTSSIQHTCPLVSLSGLIAIVIMGLGLIQDISDETLMMVLRMTTLDTTGLTVHIVRATLGVCLCAPDPPRPGRTPGPF